MKEFIGNYLNEVAEIAQKIDKNEIYEVAQEIIKIKENKVDFLLELAGVRVMPHMQFAIKKIN